MVLLGTASPCDAPADSRLQTPACIQPLVLCRIPKDLVLGSGPRVGTFL